VAAGTSATYYFKGALALMRSSRGRHRGYKAYNPDRDPGSGQITRAADHMHGTSISHGAHNNLTVPWPLTSPLMSLTVFSFAPKTLVILALSGSTFTVLIW
jgi:hypothetical protein